ncbi:MAG: hypothetical protein EZS28_025021, partial [Streblomastix strix]
IMTTIQTNQIRVHKSKHASTVKKELSEEDKARLQAIDDAITNGFRKSMQIPPLQIPRNQLQPIFSHKLSNVEQIAIQSREFNINETAPARRQIGDGLEEERGVQTDRPRRREYPQGGQPATHEVSALKSKAGYNIHKYKKVPRQTAQVEPKQVVNDTQLSHPNLEVQKFIIDTIWRCVDSRKKGEDFIFNSDNYIKLWALITQEEEKDIEVVMEEPLMRYNSCTSKNTRRKRLQEQMIIEKLHRVNKDFVRLSDKLELDIGPDDF